MGKSGGYFDGPFLCCHRNSVGLEDETNKLALHEKTKHNSFLPSNDIEFCKLMKA